MMKRLNRRREGAHLVEFAFVAPIFFMFLFGVYEYGRMVFVRQVMQAAAREGARYAVVHTNDKTTTDIRNVVLQTLGSTQNQLTGGATVSIYRADPLTGNNTGVWTDAGFGDAIAVELTGVYRPILPVFLFMPNSINMKAKAAMYSEAN